MIIRCVLILGLLKPIFYKPCQSVRHLADLRTTKTCIESTLTIEGSGLPNGSGRCLPMHAMQTHSISIAWFSHCRIVQILNRTSAKLCHTVFSKQLALRLRYISKFATKLIIFGELTGVHTPLLFQSVLLDLVGHCGAAYA